LTLASERRRYPRFTAWLPLRLTAATHKVELGDIPLLTQNVSKNGICFPSPRRIEPGEFIEVEVTLVGHGPHGKDVHVYGAGRVVRAEASQNPGWYKLAATFGESPSGDQPDWYNLVAEFEEPPPQ
jgi:PilZ domain